MSLATHIKQSTTNAKNHSLQTCDHIALCVRLYCLHNDSLILVNCIGLVCVYVVYILVIFQVHTPL